MKTKFFLLLLMFFLCPFVAIGTDVNLPDTPAGRRLKEMLSVIETEDQVKVLAFIRDFDPEFAEGFPEEEHLNVFKQIRDRTGGLEIVEILNSEPHALTVITRAKKTKKLLRVILGTSEAEPFKINDIGVRPLDEDAGDPKTTEGKSAAVPPEEPPVPDLEKRIKRVDEFLSTLTDHGLHGGVLIAKNGQIIFEKGYGFADRTAKVPITVDTVFDIASATKDFTHVAILQLVAQQRIAMKDQLSKFFPNVPADKASITIQNLIEHTAGMPEYSGKDNEVLPKEKFLERIFKAELLSVPGKKESYSNPGYSLLAAIIEKVSGLSYEVYLKKNIFDGIGMNQTGYVLPKWKPNQIAHSYGNGKDRGSTFHFPHAADGPYWNLRGNGGTLSTLRDMFKFYEACVSGELFSAGSNLRIFAPDQMLALAGSDGYHYFLYFRSPQTGISSIIATTDPAVKAPYVNKQVMEILRGGEAKLP
jgi:CubicO group peptidase (beta-lactamase class C family)